MSDPKRSLMEAADALYYIWECRGEGVDWEKVRSLALRLHDAAEGLP